MERILDINAKDAVAKFEKIPGKYQWHGGRELTSAMLSNDVKPTCDPLGPENVLVIATGLLAGTPAPNFSRTSIGAKSPLTGGIKEANVGGKAGFMLGHHGIRAIKIEGKPKGGTFHHVIIDSAGQARMEDATKDAGLGNYALARELLDRFGKGACIISTGIAGVHQMPMASIAVLDLQNYPSRHAGRGGLGAVMGSKGIKSIIIEKAKESKITYADATTFKKVAGDWSKELKTTRVAFSKLGTPMTIGVSNMLQGLPTRNFKEGVFAGAEKIGGDHLHELIVQRGGRFGIPCMPGCAIQCSNLLPGIDGKHLTSSLEYETICLNGSNLLIDDIDTIARIDHECDDIGLDTIEFGGTVGVLMEAGQFEFGDRNAPFKVLDEVRNATEKGKIYGQGVYRVGSRLGVKRVPAVKKQGISAYDPRVYKGMGVTFCTTPMGADHTAGAAIYKRPGLKEIETYGDVFDTTGKEQLSYELQALIGAMDMLGCCYFVGPSKGSLERAAALIKARHGWACTWETLFEKARAMLKNEVEFNEKAGFKPEDNELPAFFYEEPSVPSGRTWEYSKDAFHGFWREKI